MTVVELINLLEKQPTDLEVMVQSYEEGFDPVTDLKIIPVSENNNKSWYVGMFDEDNDSSQQVLVIQSKFNRMEGEDEL